MSPTDLDTAALLAAYEAGWKKGATWAVTREWVWSGQAPALTYQAFCMAAAENAKVWLKEHGDNEGNEHGGQTGLA